MRDYEELVSVLRDLSEDTGDECAEAADAIEDLIAALTASNEVIAKGRDKWISVKERLPKESGYTIVFCADGDRRHVTFAKYQKTPRRWELSGARSYWRVLWWMPLPEPPKEDDNGED